MLTKLNTLREFKFNKWKLLQFVFFLIQFYFMAKWLLVYEFSLGWCIYLIQIIYILKEEYEKFKAANRHYIQRVKDMSVLLEAHWIYFSLWTGQKSCLVFIYVIYIKEFCQNIYILYQFQRGAQNSVIVQKVILKSLQFAHKLIILELTLRYFTLDPSSELRITYFFVTEYYICKFCQNLQIRSYHGYGFKRNLLFEIFLIYLVNNSSPYSKSSTWLIIIDILLFQLLIGLTYQFTIDIKIRDDTTAEKQLQTIIDSLGAINTPKQKGNQDMSSNNQYSSFDIHKQDPLKQIDCLDHLGFLKPKVENVKKPIYQPPKGMIPFLKRLVNQFSRVIYIRFNASIQLYEKYPQKNKQQLKILKIFANTQKNLQTVIFKSNNTRSSISIFFKPSNLIQEIVGLSKPYLLQYLISSEHLIQSASGIWIPGTEQNDINLYLKDKIIPIFLKRCVKFHSVIPFEYNNHRYYNIYLLMVVAFQNTFQQYMTFSPNQILNDLFEI